MSTVVTNILESLDNPTKVVTVDQLVQTRVDIFLHLKRLAAEAGFNLVDGSFEEGAVVSNANDVVWFRNKGTYFGWGGTIPVGGYIIPAGSTPATAGGVGVGAWIDRTDVTLRSEINVVVKRFASGNGYVSESITPAGDTAILDLAKATVFRVTLNTHITQIVFTNASGEEGSSRYATLILRQGTGVNLVSWPENVRWSYGHSPVLSYEKDVEDCITLVNFGTDAHWYGFLTGGWIHV